MTLPLHPSSSFKPTPSVAPGLLLYVATLFIEIPAFLARLVLFYLVGPCLFFPIMAPLILVVAALPDLFTAGPDAYIRPLNSLGALILATAPVVLSLLTFLLLPGGSGLTRYALGARSPSLREQEAVSFALEGIAAQAPPNTLAPNRWFVIDQPTLNAYVIGTTLYLTRSLITSSHLAPVLAHELGHLNHYDGRLTLALRRLVLPPVYLLSRRLGQVAPRLSLAGAFLPGGCASGCVVAGLVGGLYITLVLAGGGLGMVLLSPLWGWYWREREYAADQFAAQCGQAAGLVSYLEQHQFFDVAVPYLKTEHPPIELRIERLLSYASQKRRS